MNYIFQKDNGELFVLYRGLRDAYHQSYFKFNSKIYQNKRQISYFKINIYKFIYKLNSAQRKLININIYI